MKIMILYSQINNVAWLFIYSGNYSGTLVNALLYHCKDFPGINGEIRPGIVHRLDKDTSGVMMAAKNDAAHIGLFEQVKDTFC